jgi:hypothetical protein
MSDEIYQGAEAETEQSSPERRGEGARARNTLAPRDGTAAGGSAAY